jgi:phenylalanyl-tRNA synthetase beta chain
LTGAPLRLKAARPREAGKAIRAITSVTVEAPDLCPRYAARVIHGVKISPSPFWLRRRLELCGLRAVSNVVDATNYVLLEMGQPLHAFDHARLKEGRIVARRARARERIVTLDGVERTLHPEMLVIADASDPVAIAGVMGDSATEVGSTTSDLLLESALFQSVGIRRTAKTLGLSTESSYRFERGVDPEGIVQALDRVAGLILELAGGKVAKGVIDIRRKVPRPPRLLLRVERVRQVLGTPVPPKEIRQILHRLQCRVRQHGTKALEVLVPSHRLDLSREIDLIEEVARLRGFEQIPTTFPVSQMRPGKAAPLLEIEREIRRLLTASGFQEAINFSFTGERLFDRLRLPEGHPLRRLVRLRNPLGGETVLRSFLLPSLLQNVALNESRGVKSLRLFEISRIYRPQGEGMLPFEGRVVGMVAQGERGLLSWDGPQETVDFYDLKGVLEALEIHVGISLRLERRESIPYLHPGRQAEIFLGEELAGWIGEIHPEVIRGYDLAARPVALEIDLDLVGKYRRPTPTHAPFPRYPAVLRDVAVIVPEKTPAAEVEAVIRRTGGPLVEAVRLFDVYQGDPVPPGKRSLAFSIQYRSPDRTLTDEEVGAMHGAVLQTLMRDLGAVIR